MFPLLPLGQILRGVEIEGQFGQINGGDVLRVSVEQGAGPLIAGQLGQGREMFPAEKGGDGEAVVVLGGGHASTRRDRRR